MIGSRLQHIRGARSQEAMAKELAVHKNTYSRWERDEREPGTTELALLVEAGWNVNWLLTGEGPERLDVLQSAIQVAETHAGYGSQSVSMEDLTLAIETAEQGLEESDRTLPPAKKAALVMAIADILSKEDGEMPIAKVLRLIRATA